LNPARLLVLDFCLWPKLSALAVVLRRNPHGLAWVGITPFTMWGVRPAFAPPVPFLSESHELNVRTYVHLDGVSGAFWNSSK
jgi:uncharacterized protein YqjF (DUF2071 family)